MSAGDNLSSSQFHVRVGDDGGVKSSHDNFLDAFSAAHSLAEQKYGSAEVKHKGEKVAIIRDSKTAYVAKEHKPKHWD